MYGCDEDIAGMTTKTPEIEYQMKSVRDLLGLLMFALGKMEETTVD